MGVDYIARKSAKKRKKRERQNVGKDGVAAQRERRRKKVRRLCQGVCYKAPELTEEDKQWNDDDGRDAGAPDSDIEEAEARANSHRNASTSAAAATQKAQLSSMRRAAAQANRTKKDDKKRKRTDGHDPDDNGGGGGGGGDGGSMKAPPLLSTSVQLLAPEVLAANARLAALRKLPAGAKADALERFPPLLQACMLTSHHVEPTPVQDRCWPPALQGRDVQGVAEPGSGKTLAYLLPGLVKLQAGGHNAGSLPEGPAMLVLLPTRELAQQVAAQCRALRGITGLRTVCVFGGAPREEQAALLTSKHPHVLVATPGRLLDLVDGGELKLQARVQYLVLDEADKMLSLGFKPQLDRLYDMLLKPYDEAAAAASADAGNAVTEAKPASDKKAAKAKGKAKAAAREKPQPSEAPFGCGGGAAVGAPSGQGRPQVLLFSATMPPDVTKAAASWLRRPEVVHVSAGGANAISRTITQVVHVCAEHKKPEKLLKHLVRIRESVPAGCRTPPRLLVFANRVKTVRFLTTTLAKEGYKVAQLHGQRSQAERNQAVSDFRSGKAQILVATDVAARGLDIRSLPYVVNYDFPSRLETYVHRVGRTGRLAAYGHAYSFFTRNMAPLAPPLLELLQTHEQAVDPNLAALATAWKVAEEKLGGKAAAAAAAAATADGPAGPDDADDGGGDGDVNDDEGDGTAALYSDRLTLAEEVLLAADDLMEGLGQSNARAIAALVKKKLTKQQQQQQKLPVDKKRHQTGPDAVEGDEEDVEAGQEPRQAQGQEQGQGVKKGARAGDGQMVPLSKEQRRVMLRNQQQQQPGAGGAARQAEYVAAKKFQGAMPGYVFKKGPLGLGYYRDPLQAAAGPGVPAAAGGKKAAARAPVAAAADATTLQARNEKGKPAAGRATAAAGAGAAVSKAAAAWGLPTRNKPIIPVRHSEFLSDSDADGDGNGCGGGDLDSPSWGSDSDGEAPHQGWAASGGKAASEGTGKRLERGVKKAGAAAAAAATGVVAGGAFSARAFSDVGLDDGDADDGGAGGDDGDAGFFGGQRAAAKRKHKALPGRLRKKLRAQGSGGGKQPRPGDQGLGKGKGQVR